MVEKLYFVSSNKGKAKEVQSILNIPVEVAELELMEIQDELIENIARHKALEAYKHIGKPLIVDDVGFYIDAWNGFPGPFIKYLDSAGKADLILRMLENEKNRKATVVSAIAFHNGKDVNVFIGEIEGTIAYEKRGSRNITGINSIFIADGQTKTFSEMTLDEKNLISHRKKALDQLKLFLNQLQNK